MTGDPQMRFTQNGKAVLNIGIAGGQNGRKGREIHVEGRITSRVHDVEGHRIKQVDLVVENFQLLGPAPTGEAEA
jgi:single-stranded DNA-binding protein